jgi:hypothetical protein
MDSLLLARAVGMVSPERRPGLNRRATAGTFLLEWRHGMHRR